MILDMIRAVAAVSGALGAVAELQLGVGQLRPAAYRAAEAGVVAASGVGLTAHGGVDSFLLYRPLPAFPCGVITEKVGQQICGLSAKIQKIVQQGNDGQHPAPVHAHSMRERVDHVCDSGDQPRECNQQIQPGQPLHFHGNDEPDPNLLVGHQSGQRQKQAQQMTPPLWQKAKKN